MIPGRDVLLPMHGSSSSGDRLQELANRLNSDKLAMQARSASQWLNSVQERQTSLAASEWLDSDQERQTSLEYGLPSSVETDTSFSSTKNSKSHTSYNSHGSTTPGSATVNTKYFRRWQVVWCQEHSFKYDGGGLRERLRVSANMHGADLACVKKSHKILLHFKRLQGLLPIVKLDFFGIITDWREAKPCLELFEQLDEAQIAELKLLPSQTKPEFLVVFCENQSQHNKAVLWANKAESPFPIYCMLAPDKEQLDLRAFSDVLGATCAKMSKGNNPPPDLHPISQSQEPEFIDIHNILSQDLSSALADGVRLRL